MGNMRKHCLSVHLKSNVPLMDTLEAVVNASIVRHEFKRGFGCMICRRNFTDKSDREIKLHFLARHL